MLCPYVLLPPRRDSIQPKAVIYARYRSDLQVGDMQLCNNYTVLHSRTGYQDFPEPRRNRHMIRLWLTLRQRRPMAERFPAHNGYGQNQIVEAALRSAVQA